MNRLSSYTNASTATNGHVAPKTNLWTSMLAGVASAKRLPEKNLLVLGGTGERQKDFLEALTTNPSTHRPQLRRNKQPPLANDFALGYTYYDVFDADQDDTLARLSVYMLAEPSPSFTPLLKPLLTEQTTPNTLIVILLHWSEPWLWLRQLRDWIRLLRPLLVSLDDDCKDKMMDVMNSWRDRGRGNRSLDGSGVVTQDDIVLPLGPGEWEEGLGLPLCVVCQNAAEMEILERERSWREEDFDFVLQFLRTVLLKHGASLIYTTPSVPSPLQTLLHASLGIQTLLKKEALKTEVIARDKVLVPTNWDSWGKIRVLREGFDVEAVNQGWSLDIATVDVAENENTATPGGALIMYEEMITDPTKDTTSSAIAIGASQDGLDVKSVDTQIFLATQLEVLEKLRQNSEQKGPAKRDGVYRSTSAMSATGGSGTKTPTESRVNDHIGPVQFNMGGIQVDADDMLQRLKVRSLTISLLRASMTDRFQERQMRETPEPESAGPSTPAGGASGNEALASFFAGLMQRGGSAPGSPSPKPRNG